MTAPIQGLPLLPAPGAIATATAAKPAGATREAKRAKELGYDAIHDTVHEMCKDEARHGEGFRGLLARHFNQV